MAREQMRDGKAAKLGQTTALLLIGSVVRLLFAGQGRGGNPAAGLAAALLLILTAAFAVGWLVALIQGRKRKRQPRGFEPVQRDRDR